MNAKTTGRGWAYTGVLLGGAVSIAANVAHSYVPPAAAAAGWQPHTGAVVSAIVWPVFLFVAIEILARVAWPAGWWWWLVRFGGLVPVALLAALVSYRHLSGLLAFYGEDTLTSRLGPLAVDGLMVMATGALIATGARRLTEAATSAARPSGSDGLPRAVVAPDSPPRTRPKAVTAAAKVASARRRLPDASVAQIAARANVSESTARRHLATLDAPTVASPSGAVPAQTNGYDLLAEVRS